jgi:hypothetical protein
MIRDQLHLQHLSDEFEINPEDVLLTAINACGIANSRASRRMRFEFAPFGRGDDPVYLIPSFERKSSPFHIEGEELYLRDAPVGVMRNTRGDDIVMGYFRNGHHNLTLNSNSRSICTGCMFCYTRLDPASDPQMSDEEELDAYLSFLKTDLGWQDLRPVTKISVCSGCFYYEDPAIRHMELVGRVAQRHGFSGELHILSSVIRSVEGLQRIAGALSPFHLTLTVECFENRFEILKRSKAELDFDGMLRVLADAKTAGIKTDFTYLVGLDPMDAALAKIEALAQVTTTFPRFQIYQAHNAFQASYRTPGSERIEFFLTFRKRLEEIFRASSLRPESWENYRPLWYYSFAGAPAVSARI